MAADSEQPVPWVFGVSTRGPVSTVTSVPSNRTSATSSGASAGDGGLHPGEVTALDQDPGRSEPVDGRRARSAMASTSPTGRGWDAGQQGRLPQVGRDHQGVRQQGSPVGVDAPVVQEDPAGGGDHHRVHHQPGQPTGAGQPSHLVDDGGGRRASRS